MFVLKIMIIILELMLIGNLIFLSILMSEDFEEMFEEECKEFYHKYIAENDLFPIEYRSDIGQMDKVMKMIKENPKKYSYIPEFEVFCVYIHVQVCSGNTKIVNKFEESAIFLGMTLCACVATAQVIGKYLIILG